MDIDDELTPTNITFPINLNNTQIQNFESSIFASSSSSSLSNESNDDVIDLTEGEKDIIEADFIALEDLFENNDDNSYNHHLFDNPFNWGNDISQMNKANNESTKSINQSEAILQNQNVEESFNQMSSSSVSSFSVSSSPVSSSSILHNQNVDESFNLIQMDSFSVSPPSISSSSAQNDTTISMMTQPINTESKEMNNNDSNSNFNPLPVNILNPEMMNFLNMLNNGLAGNEQQQQNTTFLLSVIKNLMQENNKQNP
ncbi:hypothetical protein Glove_146g44 [Diversispora epigaea]|uniref:Uncharacterized protein n=1 Tax=Diversispora epigaea TaxID=1348612 RepID=A0A397ITS7_9GLOM|nr:hypothetical protein Glove_146g44 [Diversispora epigaea]